MKDHRWAKRFEGGLHRVHVAEVEREIPFVRVVRAAAGQDVRTLAAQLVDEISADESSRAGHERPHAIFPCAYEREREDRRSRSASTIVATSSSKLTVGVHPSIFLALPASPIKTSTSAGRTKRGSMTTYGSNDPRPAASKALRTKSRTLCVA